MEEKSKRPEDTDFKQQRLKAWQPLLTPQWVIGAFVVIGCVFLPVGIVILTASEKVVELRQRYDDIPQCSVAGQTCNVTITVEKDMAPPVYFYYELSNFYQNHRRYVKSRSDQQLLGNLNSGLDQCDPAQSGNGGLTLVPCGLIASSYFNDVFTAVACPVNGNCTSIFTPETAQGIAWSSDVEDKFKYTPFTEGVGYTAITTKNVTLPRVDNEELIVWMRTAGLPTFRKLHRRLMNTGFSAGDSITVTVVNNFNVSSFDGTKTVVFTTTSWLGGRNSFLGVAYIVVGALCLTLAALFFAKYKLNPRKMGDLTKFQWSTAANTNYSPQDL